MFDWLTVLERDKQNWNRLQNAGFLTLNISYQFPKITSSFFFHELTCVYFVQGLRPFCTYLFDDSVLIQRQRAIHTEVLMRGLPHTCKRLDEIKLILGKILQLSCRLIVRRLSLRDTVCMSSLQLEIEFVRDEVLLIEKHVREYNVVIHIFTFLRYNQINWASRLKEGLKSSKK